MSDTYDLYHCCRWCKYHKDGLCLNDQAFEPADNFELDAFWEDGTLSESIKEGLDSNDIRAAMNRIEQALAYTELSKNKRESFLATFYDEWETIKDLLTEQIDEQVSSALMNFDFQFEYGVRILNSEKFYCRYFF